MRSSNQRARERRTPVHRRRRPHGGNQRIGLELEGSIDRRELDLKWNQTLPNGNLLVANDVKLVVSVSAVKAA